MRAFRTTPDRTGFPLRFAGGGLFLAGLIVALPWLMFLGLMVIFTASLMATHLSFARPAGFNRIVQHPVLADNRSRPDKIPPASRRDDHMTAANAPRPAEPPEPDPARPSRMIPPRVRLRPIVPLHRGLPIHSWLGGNPQISSDIDWPMAGGKPALFLAQISCAHLPPRLWGKRGPRDGWLLAFTPQDQPGEPILRHVSRFGEERHPPGTMHYPTTTPIRDDILARATGQAATTPRWPLEVIVESRPDSVGLDRLRCASKDEVHAAKLPDDTDLSDPRFQPFDWGSAMVLLECLFSKLDWQYRVVSALVDPDAPDPNTQVFLDSLAQTQTGVGALRDELVAARDTGLAFSSELLALLLRGLDSLTLNSVEPSDDGLPVPVTMPLLDNKAMRDSYFRWFDHYARRLYTDAPEALPKPQRQMFETYWAWHALHEYGEMGGAPAKDDPEELTVLRLPQSNLMGWSFGQPGEFHITLPSELLASGDLDIGGDIPTVFDQSLAADRA